ncbi:Mov34/MPN/PAD-1 family protein [Ureibacillus chungkukjangi]
MLERHNHFVQLACEIHSHHEMPSRPSATDNASERQPGMFYVIVGKTNQEFPSVYARTFTLERGHITIKISDLFEDGTELNLNDLPSFPLESIQIKS